MRRDNGDDSWNYIRLYANIRQYVHMSPLGDNTYESVYLKGHPALTTSDSDDPLPGSWHSKDVFTPHPNIPDVWKYVTRIDDRITLINGETVLSLSIEGRRSAGSRSGCRWCRPVHTRYAGIPRCGLRSHVRQRAPRHNLAVCCRCKFPSRSVLSDNQRYDQADPFRY